MKTLFILWVLAAGPLEEPTVAAPRWVSLIATPSFTDCLNIAAQVPKIRDRDYLCIETDPATAQLMGARLIVPEAR